MTSGEPQPTCPRCRAEIPAGSAFCVECGSALPSTCPSCGAATRPEQRFCGRCGTVLTPRARPAGVDDRAASRAAAGEISAAPPSLEGERKQVTVLFADLKSSLELVADRDPEEARQLLDPVLEQMIAAVRRYGGTVNQVMGDGIMALFGAPVAQEDHAVRACYAAVTMQDHVSEYADLLRRTEGIPVQIRAGLNSGEVVVRAIPNDLRMDYTAVGLTTHLAARMEQMARPGTTLLTAATWELAGAEIETRPLGPVAVKGLRMLVEAHELLGARPRRSRVHAVARGLTRLVGRDAELELLERRLREAAAGRGQLVAVVGEAGVGKSRLFHEFIAATPRPGWLVLETNSVSYGKSTPYRPLIDLLKRHFNIDARDDARTVQHKVSRPMLELDPALRDDIPAVLSVLEALPEDSAFAALDPIQRRQRVLDALRRFVLCQSQRQPVAAVFEDLHWIDSETQTFLDELVESIPGARVLLLVNYRPEYRHGWTAKTYYTQIRIDPLSGAVADELLADLVGRDESLAPLKQQLVARTEGNPFFLEETVWALEETGGLAGERGAYRLGKPIQAIQVPATVQAVVASRIDRLLPEDKRLLQSAAVIGKDVPHALLGAIADMAEHDFRDALARLQAGEFIYETALFPDREYTFKHSLIHEVAYTSLLLDRRRILHARVFRAIEALHPARLAEHTDRLAHHALRGELWAPAVAYLRQAGARAAASSAYPEAVSCAEQALEALGHLPETASTLEAAIDLRFELRNALVPLGQYSAVLGHLAQAEKLAEALGDRGRLGWVRSYMCNAFRMMNEHLQAVSCGAAALDIATAEQEPALRVATDYHLGQAHHTLGDYRRAVRHLQRNVDHLTGELVRERFGMPGLLSVASRTWLVWSLAELGEFAEGETRGHEAMRIAEAADHVYSRLSAASALGHLYLRRGDLAEALTVLEAGLALGREWNTVEWLARLAASAGYAHALSGRPDEGLLLMNEAGERAAAMGTTAGRALWAALLAEVLFLAGREDEARQLGAFAVDLARERGERGYHVHALWLVGELASRGSSSELEAAEAAYREGRARARDLGMRPLAAECTLGLGRVRRRLGQHGEAAAEIRTALALFRSMGMTCWIARAEDELAELG